MTGCVEEAYYCHPSDSVNKTKIVSGSLVQRTNNSYFPHYRRLRFLVLNTQQDANVGEVNIDRWTYTHSLTVKNIIFRALKRVASKKQITTKYI